MPATHATDPTTPSGPVLYLAFELGRGSWKLAFTTGAGQKPRLRSQAAGNLVGLGFEIKWGEKLTAPPSCAPSPSCAPGNFHRLDHRIYRVRAEASVSAR
jgi:hypothetical protein